VARDRQARHADIQTHRRPWQIYISLRLCLTRNVIIMLCHACHSNRIRFLWRNKLNAFYPCTRVFFHCSNAFPEFLANCQKTVCFAAAQSARNVNNRKRCDTSADDADKEFPRVMFLMHQWFMSSKDLAELFMDLYPFRSASCLTQCAISSTTLVVQIEQLLQRVCPDNKFWTIRHVTEIFGTLVQLDRF